MWQMLLSTAVLLALLLQLSKCSDAQPNDIEATLDYQNRRKRSGGCCKDIEDELDELTNTIFEIGFDLQEFINLGQNQKCPAYSCQQISSWKPGSRSDYYWLRGPKDNTDAYAAHMYCQMDMDIPIFGTTQGMMKVADLDMNDRDQDCPHGFKLITRPKRLCAQTRDKGCTSIIFPTHYIEYKRICGRALAYQVGSNNAFHRFECDHPCTIDDPYVDGLSFTYGKHPRKHIWSLAAQWIEKKDNYPAHCPCAKHSKSRPPDFVGSDYFCETGKYWDSKIDLSDPLWDGEGCGKEEKKCCEELGPPWFCRDLAEPTTKDIEVRVCTDESKSNEDVWVELIQLYVQ